MMKEISNKHFNNIAKVMFDYWILVILWQTFRPVANRSLVDSLVKIALFGMVVIYALKHRNSRNSGNILVLLIVFVTSQLITILLDTVTTGTMITVVFMIAEIIVFLIWLHNEQISPKMLEWFGERIIFVGIIMGAYSIIFRNARFIRALTNSSAYGSEAKSFLYSNHEYALYLSAAIIFVIWMHFSKKYGMIKFLLLIGFLGLNLISTFSRTAIIGCIIAAFVLAFFYGKGNFTKISLATLLFAVIGFSYTPARAFILNKILKGSIEKSGSIVDQGRASMYQVEWQYFGSGSLIEKLFGHGYAGNVSEGHDAYLMILNTGGIIMFLFFLIVFIKCFKITFTIFKMDKRIGALCLGLQMLVLLYMAAQTPIIFFSSMDSFFITMLFVMIPMYVHNYMEYSIAITQNSGEPLCE